MTISDGPLPRTESIEQRASMCFFSGACSKASLPLQAEHQHRSGPLLERVPPCALAELFVKDHGDHVDAGLLSIGLSRAVLLLLSATLLSDAPGALSEGCRNGGPRSSAPAVVAPACPKGLQAGTCALPLSDMHGGIALPL